MPGVSRQIRPMPHTSPPELSTGRAVSLYVGALLGPSLLLLPGLAASLAGPASILAWAGLLAVSGLLARVFTAFGTRVRADGGVIAYATAGLGARAGRAVGWCFLAGVMLGAPVVCLIGGAYIADALGAGHLTAVLSAAGLLAAVVVLTLSGTRIGTGVQLGLVALLIALVAIAVAGAAPAARGANWTPFAPHGWTALGAAASALMLSFVGWEAVAPLTSRLRSPGRQLPRVIAAAFAVTATLYLALSAATIAVLGPHAGTAVPLASLLNIALGPAGRAIAAVAAVALTLAATNAYLTGATEMLAALRHRPTPKPIDAGTHPSGTRGPVRPTVREKTSPAHAPQPVRPPENDANPDLMPAGTNPGHAPARTDPDRAPASDDPGRTPAAGGPGRMDGRVGGGRAPLTQVGAGVAGVVLFAGDAVGFVGTARLVALPTALFLAVYLGCMVSGVRVLRGSVRFAAAGSAVAVAVVLAFCGWALVPAALVAGIAYVAPRVRRPAPSGSDRLGAPALPARRGGAYGLPHRVSPVAGVRTGRGRGRAGSRG